MALEQEVLFVNVAYMRRLTNLNDNVDDNTVVPSIILAQDKHLQQYLGTVLYLDLKKNVSGGSLNTADAVLVDNYVRKVVCWWTMVELLPSLYVRHDKVGLVIRSAPNTSPISMDDLNREIERARQNAQFYTQRMVQYLRQNGSSHPEYHQNQNGQMMPDTNVYFENGITISRGSGGINYELVKYLTA